MVHDIAIHLTDNLRGRNIHFKVIPTLCNLQTMLEKLTTVGGDESQLKPEEKRSFYAYQIDKVKDQLLYAYTEDQKEIIRQHILHLDPDDFGASCIDIYLVAYVAENVGSGKSNFINYILESGISEKVNSAEAIWEVGKGDGVFLNLLNEDGSVRNWDFMRRWVIGIIGV